jgi:betaine-aldehyde dehydrogenase
MQHHQQYINGVFANAISGKTRNIINPATEEVFATVPDSQPEDADAAVKAARKAFDNNSWNRIYAGERGKCLFRLAHLMRSHFQELVTVEVQNNGKPKREAEFDVDDATNCLEFYGGMATKIHGETMQTPPGNFSYVVREAIGVCAQIVPWNYPLLMAVWKLAPALAAGNTVVLKTSEITPLSALYLATFVKEAGFPDGVINIITGDGPVCGNALVNHPMVDKIAFTGGNVTGKNIMRAAAESMKKITLELGGKNPAIVFDDCDMNITLDWTKFAAFANAGQVCSAGSRIYVQEAVYDAFLEKYLDGSRNIKIGNGMDDGIQMGPLVSAAHYEKVQRYIEIGKQEGAKMECGGSRPANLEKGYFLEPTVFTGVDHSMRIMREEIFGPVVCIQKFKTEKEVIALANDSVYGLAASIFTSNITRAQRILPQIKAGILWVNYYHPTFNEQPWGGYKQSGIGRELGLYGIEAYLETKQININTDENPVGWY